MTNKMTLNPVPGTRVWGSNWFIVHQYPPFSYFFFPFTYFPDSAKSQCPQIGLSDVDRRVIQPASGRQAGNICK